MRVTSWTLTVFDPEKKIANIVQEHIRKMLRMSSS